MCAYKTCLIQSCRATYDLSALAEHQLPTILRVCIKTMTRTSYDERRHGYDDDSQEEMLQLLQLPSLKRGQQRWEPDNGDEQAPSMRSLSSTPFFHDSSMSSNFSQGNSQKKKNKKRRPSSSDSTSSSRFSAQDSEGSTSSSPETSPYNNRNFFSLSKLKVTKKTWKDLKIGFGSLMMD